MHTIVVIDFLTLKWLKVCIAMFVRCMFLLNLHFHTIADAKKNNDPINSR
jgi:hypothetical protein